MQIRYTESKNLQLPFRSANQTAMYLKKFSSEKAVVQGVIDCAFFENGETIVLDYKTDNVKDEEELKRRYSGQLSIYKRAAEEIFSQPVKETLIFLLRLNKTVVLDI